MPRLQIPVHSYGLRSKPASPARLLNCYAEPLPPDAKSPAILGRAPGIAPWLTVGPGPIAGQHAALGALFVVSGPRLYRVSAGKAITDLGHIGTPGNIDMASNTSAVVVVNEPSAYYWNGTFAQITDADFAGAGDVEFLNNYLLFREPHSARVFGADLGSASSFDALNYATSEGAPDDLTGLKVDHLQSIQFGTNSVEIWENDSSAGAWPFIRAINGFIEIGCLNGRSIAKINNTVFWLASDYTVRSLSGITPVRVSTHAIEQRLAAATIASAQGSSYTKDGHLFYMLTFDEGTFVYDITTQLWHERESYGEVNWSWGSPVEFAGEVLVGSTTDGRIGALDVDTYEDHGTVQRMSWTYQTVWAEGQRAFHDRFEMVFEMGVGTTTGQGADPQVMLEYSDNGGQTWKALPTKSLGRAGKYEARAIWSALGSARQRVYRGTVSDPARVTLSDTFIEVRGGRL